MWPFAELLAPAKDDVRNFFMYGSSFPADCSITPQASLRADKEIP